jgi:hypothetical protein
MPEYFPGIVASADTDTYMFTPRRWAEPCSKMEGDGGRGHRKFDQPENISDNDSILIFFFSSSRPFENYTSY